MINPNEIRLVSILMKSSHFEVLKPAGSLLAKQCSVTFKITNIMTPNDNFPDRLLVFPKLKLSIEDSLETDPEAKKVLNIEIAYAVIYENVPKLSKEELESFVKASPNSPVRVAWPYLRHDVNYFLTTAGYPPYDLPLISEQHIQ